MLAWVKVILAMGLGWQGVRTLPVYMEYSDTPLGYRKIDYAQEICIGGSGQIAALTAPTMTPEPTPQPTIEIPEITSTPTPVKVIETQPNPTEIPLIILEPTRTPEPTATPIIETQNSLTTAVNSYRKAQGKAPIQTTSELCNAAKQRAEKVGSNLNHEGYQEVLSAIPHSASAENLWWGTSVSIEAIVSAWDQSSGHKENMLGDWTQGCGEISGNTAAFLFIR